MAKPPTALQLRLEEVMHAMGWTRADLMRASGQSSSLVSQWLGKSSEPIRSMGLEPALRLQAATQYSALWIATGKGPKRVPVAAWPFEHVSFERFARLRAIERGMVEQAMLDVIERCERGPQEDADMGREQRMVAEWVRTLPTAAMRSRAAHLFALIVQAVSQGTEDELIQAFPKLPTPTSSAPKVGR